MKDLEFVGNYFNVIAGFLTIFFAILGIIGICGICVACFEGDGGMFFAFALYLAILWLTWFISIKIIKLKKIIFTRFVATTENVLEITEMLEEKLKK